MSISSSTTHRNRPSRLRAQVATLLVAVAAATAAHGVALVRGPYLQHARTGTEIAVVWKTDVPTNCEITLGQLGSQPQVGTGTPGTDCVVYVSGLTPNTTYAYTPRANGIAIAEESTFTTADSTRPSYSFLVLGDSGSGGTAQLRVRDRMLATPADFILHTGDMVYEKGALEDFDRKFFEPYQDLLRRLVLWPCLGNHDVETENGFAWRHVFVTPANNPAGSEHYYSFDYGNAHVVVLDSNRNTAPGSAQHSFLAQDLAVSTAPWKFVVFHHSIYSGGKHGSDLAIRANLLPLLDQYGVDVVFMGHDHHYERTLPLRGDLVVEPGMGTTYITTGGGGAELYPAVPALFTAYAESAFHFVRVRVDGSTLLAQMIRDDGTIGDTLTLVKGDPPALPSCGDGLVNQPIEECDGDDRPACLGACQPDCTCAPACEDGFVDQPEETCDGLDDVACPGLCLSDCRCTDPGLVTTLAPVADTYVESGLQATWDHGTADRVETDASPDTIAFLKFDMSVVPRFVTRALLTLRCVNASVNDATVYPVGDSSWIEGSATGTDVTSAGGAGLKWTDLDTNADGNLDAMDISPYVPDFGRWLGPIPCDLGQAATVDVTAAVAPDATLVSLALATDSADGAGFGARESIAPGDRPRLILKLGELKPTTTTTTTSTTTTTTSTTSTTTTASTTTSTAAPPVRCTEDGCNDGDTCTIDRCDPASGCEHQEVEGFAAVRCRFESSRLQPPSCSGQRATRAVIRAFERAAALVERASTASTSRQARKQLKQAVRLLGQAGRTVRRQGHLPVDCVVALGANLDQARIRAERLASTL